MNELHFLLKKKIIVLVGGLGLFTLMLVMPTPEGVSPEGQKMAATDWDEAERFVADHLRELQRLRTHRRLVGLKRTATLAEFAAEHLVDKAKNENITDAWLGVSERRLRAAVEFFGTDRELSSIRPSDVKKWMAWIT